MPTQNESTGRGDSSPFGGFIAKDNAIAYGVNGSILHWHGGGVRVRPILCHLKSRTVISRSAFFLDEQVRQLPVMRIPADALPA